jgi:hypothetical protein
VFNQHPAFESSRRVLGEMLAEARLGGSTSDVMTEALRRELVLKDVSQKANQLSKYEMRRDFPEVAKMYQVIDGDTRTVIVDRALVERLNRGERIRWQELVPGSVQIWARKVQEWAIRPVPGHEELFYWTGDYEPEFLGYMKGILPLIAGRDTGLFA